MWDSSLVETSSDSWQALWAPGWSSFCQPFCCDVYCYPCNFIEVRTLKCTGQGSCFGGQGGEQKRAMLRFERAFLWRLTDDLEPMVHSNSTQHHSKAFQTKGNSAAQLYHSLWRPSWLPGRYKWGILRVEGLILWCFMSLMIQDLRTWRNWLAITYQLPISVAQPWKITSSDCLNLRRSGFDCLQPRARRLLTLK